MGVWSKFCQCSRLSRLSCLLVEVSLNCQKPSTGESVTIFEIDNEKQIWMYERDDTGVDAEASLY